MKHMTAKSMRKALKTKWIEQIYQKDSVDSTLTWAKEEAESCLLANRNTVLFLADKQTAG